MARRRGRRDCGSSLYRLRWWAAAILSAVAWHHLLQSAAAQSPPPPQVVCPLNISLLNPQVAKSVESDQNATDRCSSVDSGLEGLISLYLNETGFFLLPNGTSESCVDAYQAELESMGVTGFNISTSCPRQPFFSERGTELCQNIQTAQDFRTALPLSQLASLNNSCSGFLARGTACGNCNLAINDAATSLSSLGGNNASCQQFVEVYTIGVVNPVSSDTSLCLLYISNPISGGGASHSPAKFIAVGVGGMLLICLLVLLGVYWRYRHAIAARRLARARRTTAMLSATSVPTSSINWFTMEELKKATGNFTRENLLGTGGYGNVYKGTLPDGSVVAVKRFKNCSPAGDLDFVHEVEMISSVRHRHLVGIRGCCVDSSESLGGHQRMIVYDYLPNGSLTDHLFAKKAKKMKGGNGENCENGNCLDWNSRTKIAVGTARGLAYLHHEVLPAIFHRDIKPSNILLDKDFNALLADFGLAKFTPEGVSHLTTNAAGTLGYVAPEYAMYGQLTEKGDVYSFGMVVLELVTGRKAVSSATDDPPFTLVSDWAWELVKDGQWKSAIDPRLGFRGEGGGEAGMEIEKFLLVGLLCAHPQLHCRPSIDQVLRMLESRSAFDVPHVPDRPLPLTSNQAEVQEAVSRESKEFHDLCSITGFSSYSLSSVGYMSMHSFKSEESRIATP